MSDLFGENWIYEIDRDNTVRYVLGERGENPLICIGVNPSTATPEKLDNTLRRVKGVAKDKGYDGWMMLNLYPQRATNPKNLHKIYKPLLVRENTKHWNIIFEKYYWATVWAAWGTLIEKRKYLQTFLNTYVDAVSGDRLLSCKWITIGRRSNAGHPHHPLYLPNAADVEEFDIVKYLKGK